MWDATATQAGICIFDWQNQTIPDPTLDAAFDGANKKLQGLGFDSPQFLRLGWIAYGECRIMLAYGTKRPVFDESDDGIMIWTADAVQEIDKGADWNFSLRDVLEKWEDPTDDFYVGAFHQVRLFWQTCVEFGLGIYITW